MKLPIEWSELRSSALTSALFVIMYAPLALLTGASFVPTTIKHFILLYIVHFCFSVTFYCWKNYRRKSTAPLRDGSENGNIT